VPQSSTFTAIMDNKLLQAGSHSKKYDYRTPWDHSYTPVDSGYHEPPEWDNDIVEVKDHQSETDKLNEIEAHKHMLNEIEAYKQYEVDTSAAHFVDSATYIECTLWRLTVDDATSHSTTRTN
jgi:hypothetical protein